MDLMYDAGCHLATFHDAVRIGKSAMRTTHFCSEDPYADGGVSTFSHRRLKDFVKTPIMVTEHIHTPEVSTDLLLTVPQISPARTRTTIAESPGQ